jgi:N-acetyl-anhydromuramyl-L-alanine amidase AmpD
MSLIKFQKPTREVSKVFLHCSASDRPEHDNIEVIKEWHLARGFSDVGYHFFIRKDGTIEEGRPIEQVPAAQKGFNTGSIAICCHGLTEFTDIQLSKLYFLCKSIDKVYQSRITFHGHCEVNSNKTCPVFDYKNILDLDSNGKML